MEVSENKIDGKNTVIYGIFLKLHIVKYIFLFMLRAHI